MSKIKGLFMDKEAEKIESGEYQAESLNEYSEPDNYDDPNRTCIDE